MYNITVHYIIIKMLLRNAETQTKKTGQNLLMKSLWDAMWSSELYLMQGNKIQTYCQHDFCPRKNEYYNGLSPWLPGTVAKSKVDIYGYWKIFLFFSLQFKYDRKETTTSFASDTRTKDKADHFDISANLALDFMSMRMYFTIHISICMLRWPGSCRRWYELSLWWGV